MDFTSAPKSLIWVRGLLLGSNARKAMAWPIPWLERVVHDLSIPVPRFVPSWSHCQRLRKPPEKRRGRPFSMQPPLSPRSPRTNPSCRSCPSRPSRPSLSPTRWRRTRTRMRRIPQGKSLENDGLSKETRGKLRVFLQTRTVGVLDS